MGPAKRAKRPSAVTTLPMYQAQLATLTGGAPEGEQWLHEIKYDGYRIGCRIDRGKVRLESRRGQDWTAAYPEIVAAARALPVQRALLDGEVAILLPDGRTSFQGLQNVNRGARQRGLLVYFVFDLLHLDGSNVAALPLERRKEQLRALLAQRGQTSTLRYSQHFLGDGPSVLEHACKLGLEGIVSKRRDLPYRAGRNTDWLKSKCTRRQEFVVGGFTEGEGTRQGIGSVLIGYYDDAGALRFAGKVGNGPGFTAEYTTRLQRELEQIEQSHCPFQPRPKGPLGRHAHWVRPLRVVEVSFTEWTEGGAVRHPLLQGFRPDKAPQDVRREVERALDTSAPGPAAKSAATPKGRPRLGA